MALKTDPVIEFRIFEIKCLFSWQYIVFIALNMETFIMKQQVDIDILSFVEIPRIWSRYRGIKTLHNFSYVLTYDHKFPQSLASTLRSANGRRLLHSDLSIISECRRL